MFPFLNSNRNPFQNIPSYIEKLQSNHFSVEDLLDGDDILQFVNNGADDAIKTLYMIII